MGDTALLGAGTARTVGSTPLLTAHTLDDTAHGYRHLGDYGSATSLRAGGHPITIDPGVLVS